MDAIVGYSDSDIFPCDIAEAYLADDRHVMSTCNSKSTETSHWRYGRPIWTETFKAP